NRRACATALIPPRSNSKKTSKRREDGSLGFYRTRNSRRQGSKRAVEAPDAPAGKPTGRVEGLTCGRPQVCGRSPDRPSVGRDEGVPRRAGSLAHTFAGFHRLWWPPGHSHKPEGLPHKEPGCRLKESPLNSRNPLRAESSAQTVPCGTLLRGRPVGRVRP